MPLSRGAAMAKLLEDLGNGDPIAWGFVGIFLVAGTVLGLFTLKIRRDFKREDEARAKKYGRRP